MSEPRNPSAFLLAGVSQYEVDFVIPRVGVDIPLGIDPFLLFKSRNPEFKTLHRLILDVFASGIEALRHGRIREAESIFQFPEAAEIGLGYTKSGKRGSGLGSYLTDLIIETLKNSPQMIERGLRHVEELQLISVGIGPDRISDMTANIIKEYLISYTQSQCELWRIPVREGVPIGHLFDRKGGTWSDGYFDLPVSPMDGTPILLVPRRIVRALPWINYNDFSKLEFSTFLRAKAAKSGPRMDKQGIAAVNRGEIERVEKYIQLKEERSNEAQPTSPFAQDQKWADEIDSLKSRLVELPTGAITASEYQLTVLEILNILFNPELIDGRTEVRTVDGTERRDIIFLNDSDQTFWSYLRQEHSSIFLMFEIKNTAKLNQNALNQTAAYLGDRLGRFGFIVTRNQSELNIQR